MQQHQAWNRNAPCRSSDVTPVLVASASASTRSSIGPNHIDCMYRAYAHQMTINQPALTTHVQRCQSSVSQQVHVLPQTQCRCLEMSEQTETCCMSLTYKLQQCQGSVCLQRLSKCACFLINNVVACCQIKHEWWQQQANIDHNATHCEGSVM